MKAITGLLKQNTEDRSIEWKRATLPQEVQQLRAANSELFLRYSEYDLQKIYNAGKLIALSPHIEKNLYNTDYNKIKSLQDIKSLKCWSQYQYNLISDLYERGVQFAPTILRINTNKYYCVSGNMTLMVAKIMGIRPNIYLINILSNRYTEKSI